jgi:LysM repeat protein
MTERALPGMDGAPACPFVAFGDDREGRSTSPDHRHRCFAESPPAPRAVAHQEAYCLSSAFPVCPTFQDWARREAAHARGAGEQAETAPTAVASSAPLNRHELSEDRDAEDAGRPDALPPADIPAQRNPPRDWAAPPPWATRSAGPAAGAAAGAAGTDLPAGRAVEGQGLAGSPADRLAGGEIPAAAAWSASSAGAASTAADEDLAGLVQPKPGSVPPTRPPSEGYPPSTGTGRRPPAVSSTRPTGDAIPGPAWERMRRYEAYPTIKTRAGLPGMPSLPRVGLIAAAVAIAALALFMLPALLGIGGGGSGSPAPSGSRPAATAKPSPTVPPAPTPQVYVVKAGDNLGKIAKKYGLTIDQILAANPAIKNPNKISLGQEIVIPLPVVAETAPPSGSAAP